MFLVVGVKENSAASFAFAVSFKVFEIMIIMANMSN